MDRDKIWDEFTSVVNMPPKDLKKWLACDDSKSVGWTEEGHQESVGHHSGRRILDIKAKTKAELTDDDYRHMQKVVGYVHRHLAQGGPSNDKAHSPWRYSLMNWGHDPLMHP